MKLAAWLCLGLLCLGLSACMPEEAPPVSDDPPDAPAITKPLSEPETTLLEPPVLTVTAGAASIKATRGTTSWNYDAGGGTWCGIESDSIHPLDDASRDFLPQLLYEDSTAALTFAVEPQDVTLTAWHAAHWGNIDAEGQTLPVEDGRFSLAPGPGIYEVTARWSGADTYNGTASYAFYAAPTEEAPLLTVESGGSAVVPYQFITWSEVWTEDGLLCADRPWIDTELPELAASGQIPTLVPDGPLTYTAQATVTLGRVLCFDADFTQRSGTDWDQLEDIAPGQYYVGLEAAVLEQFVPAAESYDCTGSVFLFRLEVPDPAG